MKGKFEIIVLLAIGACLLWLLWHFTPRHAEAVRPEPVPTADATAVQTPLTIESDDSTNRDLTQAENAAALAAKLNQRLTRSGVRDHEAVLIFKNDNGYRRFLARAAQTGAEVLGKIDPLTIARVRVRAYNMFAQELLAHANDYGGVAANTFIQSPTVPEERSMHPQVPVRNNLLSTLGVTTDNSNWGHGVTIAVLDGGAVPDATLGGGRLRYLDIGLGYTGSGEDSAHGTSVAALAAGSSADARGVAPAAGLLSIRVTETDGKSDAFTITQAIVAAVDAGAQIINVSMGGYATSEALDRAIGYAIDHGTVIVAAAGNDQATRLTWPAADPRVVSVGAVDATGQQVSFSNSGPQLHLTAPGYGIQTASLNGERTFFSGTSASAPVVSGAIAAVMSETPGITAPQAVQVLQTHADDGGGAGPDPDYGNGVVDLGWAMARNDPSRADIALSSNTYDAETSTIAIVIQNRGARSGEGLMLTADVNGSSTTSPIPSLPPGASIAIKLPFDPTLLARSGRLVLRTELIMPPSFVDQIPANNRRVSILILPAL